MTRHLPILAVLVVQVGALGWIVGEQLHLRATGTPVTLLTAPVDPYDLMSGYYLDLHYRVEDQVTGRAFERGERVWLTLRKAPRAWELESVSRKRPAPQPDHVSLPADCRGRVSLRGAGRIYLPEAQREEAEALLRQQPRSGLVDLRVGPDGSIALLRLRLGGRTFGE